MRCLDTDIVDDETVEAAMTHAVLQWNYDVPEPDRVVYRGCESECQEFLLLMFDKEPDNIDGMVVTEFQLAMIRRGL